MRRSVCLLGLGLAVGLTAGCVDRSFVIETNPPGSFVLVNDRPLGSAPVDGSYVYHGTYHFTLIKEGYETLHVEQAIPRPWYAYYPLDFFAEVLWPFTIEEKHRFHYEMMPVRVANTEEVLNRAEGLRIHGHGLRPPATAPAPTVNVLPPEIPAPSPVPPPAVMPPADDGPR